MADGLCWCASDSKCPHGISGKIPSQWDDMEKIIDDVLQQFDRKTIKRFLKRDIDGNAKSALNTNIKEAYKSEGLQSALDKIATKSSGDSRSTKPNKHKQLAPLTNNSSVNLSKTAPINSSGFDVNNNAGNEHRRPETAGELGGVDHSDMSTLPSNQFIHRAKSQPKMAAQAQSGFSRDLLTGSLPKLPPRVLPTSAHERAGSPTTNSPVISSKSNRVTTAWGPDSAKPASATQTRSESPTPVNLSSMDALKTAMNQNSAPQVILNLPGETTIAVGLQRVADNLSRKILPWQAVLCPRAVECLHDVRQSMMQSKHNAFISQMKAKLEEKVLGFMQKKEEEVEIWIEREIRSWQQFMQRDEADLTEYIKTDLARITERAIAQDTAYRTRELLIATTIDDHERDSTREQLINFRRIVRSDNKGGSGAGKYASIEVRALQDSIAKAQSLTNKQIAQSNRDVTRRIEESHDWLCSLADNAVTASESEEKLKELYVSLDQEKVAALDSLHTAMSVYKEQHNSILEAIVVFAGRIHQHASDYLQREQLVSRAFLQYLLSIVNGEIKTHTNEQKKNSFAWETKSIADRAHRKESTLVTEFHNNINPLDRIVADFKDRMRVQLDHITLKLQSVLNGRENDVNARKSLIHKKLAKHVNKACNARRQRLKDATAVRRDEFELEEKCIVAVNELCTDLRSAIDQVWVKEHLKERRMYEASAGRMERLEKSALIIWNKHSHLAIGQKEEYEDWLSASRKDRDLQMAEHLIAIERSWREWRAKFGKQVKQLAFDVRKPIKSLIRSAFSYDVSVPVEQNVDEVVAQSTVILGTTLSTIDNLRSALQSYMAAEMRSMDAFSASRKAALLEEWKDNLYMLNSAVNRRVGGLKDMEADLEETIRLTILQHEVENGVFEQLSCAKMESFWLEWRSKMFAVSRNLKEDQEDYQISKQAGKVKSRASKKDRALDDLVALSKEQTAGVNASGSLTLPPIGSPVAKMKPIENGPGLEASQADKASDQNETFMDDFVGIDGAVSDTVRLRRILDEIRPEIYRDFTHKVTRGLERVRRDLGEGKRRLVPAYAVARALLLSCDGFWEKAKLSERCVGRVSSKGTLLFQEGLPTHARALFCVSSTMYAFSSLALRDHKIDCDDVFELLENIKQVLMIGLLTVSLQLGEFGEYFLRSESLWACSAFGIEPPKELIAFSDAKGIDKSVLEEMQPSGFYSEDPVDLLNTVIGLTVELSEVQVMQQQFNARWTASNANNHRQQEQAFPDQSVADDGSIAVDQSSVPFPGQELEADSVITEENITFAYRNSNAALFDDLVTRIPLPVQMNKMTYLVPAADICIYAAMLGRPEGSMEMTPHRVCQVVALWRRTALAVVTAAFDPPSSEYPRINDLVVAHNAQMSGRRRMGSGNISCVSPFETISSAIDWITSIKGLPLSVNQALCLLSRGGSCDPWLEDPKQTGRAGRIVYELNEMLDIFSCSIPRSMIHNERIQVAFQPDLFECLKRLDLNYTGFVPVEILRNYIQREDLELTNTQISVLYWSLCRVNDDNQTADNDGSTANGSVRTFATGGVYKPIVETQFEADPESYMERFDADVTRYLESMPTIDTNVIMGCLSTVLVPASAHELVSDAMKLDISARNALPTTCCVWLGQRVMPAKEAITALTVKGETAKSGGLLVGVGETSFNGKNSPNKFLVDIRTHVEVDLLTKYPEMCDVRASDRHYGPAGNNPIKSQEDHWKELTSRRLGRMDRLTISWRDTMLNEWSTSLYQSRQQRYMHRVNIVKQCVGVYHKQYASLKENIVAERAGLMSRFRAIQSELLALIQQDYNFFAFHSSFVERALRRYEGQFERTVALLTDILSQFQRHCGSIKRRGIARIAAASDKLKEELEMSCTGMILGYTAGYAQGYFDQLIERGELWRDNLTEVQGKLIIEKETFMAAKDEIDRDITIQVTDRITLDRSRTKGFVDSLSEDTAKILDTVATTRASYASLQKDANARLILRIEKAVRESRKLRVAAEQQAELEGPAMRDIRTILDKAHYACIDIVNQIKDTCMRQLSAVHPLRKPHEDKMEGKVRALEGSWKGVEDVLLPLIADYEKEVFKQLSLSRSKCLEIVGVYCETESKALKTLHRKERAGLIAAFRKHFREYDLCEAAIFERFNDEVNDTVAEMVRMWGPSRPPFIVQGLAELSGIVEESLVSATNDVVSSMQGVDDDTTMSRMEIADVFTHSLTQCYSYAQQIPTQFVSEKAAQLVEIEEMSLARNGDMVRPQVKAVLDLLVSGIEIDADFTKGYDALVTSTGVKSTDCFSELDEFVDRYTDASKPLSIGYSAALTKARITRRKEEVDSLLSAARAHIVADHSRLDVLLGAGEKDIEEWTSLTLQLVENAFHNAEQSYLSNLWPTPPTTPRLELVPEDEDRVGTLKALLKLNNSDALAIGALTYGDDDEEEQQEAERRARKQQKKAEKEARRAERENKLTKGGQGDGTPAHVKPDETRELQQGWFECCSADGYKYYFNPATDESLWELPAALKTPLYPDDDESSDDRVMETPRDLLITDGAANSAPTPVNLLRVVPADFKLEVVVDPKVVMSQVAEEARSAASFAVETALDVTAVIRGKKGKGESTIATLLGNKLSPEYLRGLHSDDGLEEKRDDETKSIDSVDQLNKYGRLISDSSSIAGDSDAAALLMEYGLGSARGTEVASLAPIEEEVQAGNAVLNDKEKGRWAALGLGPSSLPEEYQSGESSDEGEDRTPHGRNRAKLLAEERYSASQELSQMAAEEELSIHFENLVEDTNCKKFMASFAAILQENRATEEERQQLRELSGIVKPINVLTILDGLRTSWAKLDQIVKETAARERAKAALEEQLRTEEGMKRQQTILEHAEDIAEMADFLHKAGLSITTAKRVATEALLKQISTPKKLAKIWSRGHVTLEEFGIDADDVDELAAALRQLLVGTDGSNANVNASFGSFQHQHPPAGSYSPFNSGTLQPAQSFYLDPALVTEVDDYGDDEESRKYPAPHHLPSRHTPPQLANKSFAPHNSSLVRKYSMTREGYKSFRGGWIEGYSDDNQRYYYNTVSGHSSWALPDEGLSAPEDTDLEHTEHYDDATQQYYEPESSSLTLHQPTLHHPTNAFAHSYGEEAYNYENYYPEDSTPHANQSEQHQYDHSQYDHAEQHDPYYGQYGEEQEGYGEYSPQDYYSEHDPYYGQQQHHQQEYYDPQQPQYDEQGQLVEYDPYADYHHEDAHHSPGADLGDYMPPAKPRTLPVPVKLEVAVYSKKEGVARQLELLNSQDRWQNNLVKSQHYITEQKSLYLDKRAEMFDKVSARVEARLEAFVEDIKYMQKSVKKELGESNSTERDLRRLFEESHGNVIQAEKLSFVLESLEKFKVTINNRYESAFKQIEKFSTDWELIRAELGQVGDIYDEGVAANLDQCRLACEHNAKVFAYDQLKVAAATKREELRLLRRSLHAALRNDSIEAEETRAAAREEQLRYYYDREMKREEVKRELGNSGWYKTIEAEVVAAGYPPLDPQQEVVPEEEAVMSFMLTHLEMQASLGGDYDSITEATKSLAIELQAGIKEFDSVEKKNLREDGSWFNKHRETIERHEAALNSTLTKVRNRVNDGYKVLQAKIEALDFDVERAAEEELFKADEEEGN